MKEKLLKLSIVFFSALLIFTSCDESLFPDESNEDEYLVGYDLVKTMSQTQVEATLTYIKALYPDASAIADEVKCGVKIYTVEYLTKFMGNAIIASGLVCVPDSKDSCSIISFQNGTNTLHDYAPSKNPDRDLYTMLEAVSGTGFVIVIPDYIGFGSSEDTYHPYLHKESAVTCITDMLKATKELSGKHNLNIPAYDDLYLTGYSMGGWATLCLQYELETNNKGLFDLKASACGAGPYNLHYINSYVLGIEEYPMPYFLGFLINSYVNTGDFEVTVSDLIKEPYASRIPSLYDGTNDGDAINGQLTTKVADLFTQDYLDKYLTGDKYSSVRLTFLDNSISAWETSTPTVILHGSDDDFVPPQVSQNLYDDFVALGVNENTQMVQLGLFSGYDHTSGIVPCEIAAISWFIQIKAANQ